jgi:hypothetical protein
MLTGRPAVETGGAYGALREAEPGMTYAGLGVRLKVSPDTASRYVRDLGDKVRVIKGTARSGPGAKAKVYPVSASPHVAAEDACGDHAPTPAAEWAPQDAGQAAEDQAARS